MNIATITDLFRTEETRLLIQYKYSPAAIIRTGIMLMAVKERVKSRGLAEWFETNCSNRFSRRTAQHCQKAAELFFASEAAAPFLALPAEEYNVQLLSTDNNAIFMAAVESFLDGSNITAIVRGK